jgi:small subunit ribosomal protein S17e
MPDCFTFVSRIAWKHDECNHVPRTGPVHQPMPKRGIFINRPVFLGPMGRIKTKAMKRITEELMEKYTGSFTKEFSENKSKVNQFTDVRSKKLRNIVAGYATRLARRDNKDNI